MVRVFQITLLVWIAVLAVGCQNAKKEKPIWEDTKIWELAPTPAKDHGKKQLTRVHLDIYSLVIAADKADALEDIWQMLYSQPFRFNDYKAFKANLFSVGFGQNQMWQELSDLLDSAGAKARAPVSLLLFDSQENEVMIKPLGKKQTVFYTSGHGATIGETIGPGEFSLRIRTEQLPGSRGVCMMFVQPSFSVSTRSRVPQLRERMGKNELVFDAVGFRLKMMPFDFIVLGPEKYIDNKITLASHLFSVGQPKPKVRLFLIVCKKIIY